MRESDIEKYLVKKVKEIGGECRKVKWIGRKSAPDRLVVFNGVYFIELKRPGKYLNPSQQREYIRLTQLNADVRCITTIEEVDEFINEIYP
mgnify:CR=1 FL=1|jgi:hypothetical protein